MKNSAMPETERLILREMTDGKIYGEKRGLFQTRAVAA